MKLMNDGVSVTLICPYWVITEFHERYLDKNGKPKGATGRALYTKNMMSAEQCAEIIVEGACKRKRHVARWIGFVDEITRTRLDGQTDHSTILETCCKKIR